MIYYESKYGVLYKGDCLEIIPLIKKKVDLVLTDPPYGTTACKWDSVIPFDKMWESVKSISKDDILFVFTASQPFTSFLIQSNLKEFKYELIWDKKKGTAPGVAKFRPLPSHENILVFGGKGRIYNPQWGKGEPYVDKRSSKRPRDQDGHKFGYTGIFESVSGGRRYPLSVIEIKKTSVKGQHPTQKPVELMEYLIKTYTNIGDTVLDFTIGSGTTAVAAINTGRKFIGIEMNEEYCEIAKQRIIEAEKKQEDLFGDI